MPWLIDIHGRPAFSGKKNGEGAYGAVEREGGGERGKDEMGKGI